MMENNITNGSTQEILFDPDGTTPAEVLSLTYFVPLCSLLVWLTACNFQISSSLLQFIEICGANIILLFALTLLEDHLQLLLLILLLLILLNLYVILHPHMSIRQMKSILKDIKMEAVSKDLNTTFVQSYRGHLLLATSICILAVDFSLFPSRFAKTGTYGWSIMDAGVGSFVLVHGLCSSHGKNSSSKQHGLKKCFMSAFPLFVLGFFRLGVLTAVDYHKVVPEYGVHWNFFFTLAFTKMLSYCILCTFESVNPGALAVSTGLLHQFLLSKASLTSLVLSDACTTFFEANKEGICSLLGFVSIYLCGVQLGRVVWKGKSQLSEYIQLLGKLCGIGASGWILMYLLCEMVQPVSRRMANVPYCVWVVALTSLQLGIHLFHELLIAILNRVLKRRPCSSLLWEATNYNGLCYFLLSNLLTGLVNLSVNTDTASYVKASAILVLYLAILTAFSVILYTKAIRLKFW